MTPLQTIWLASRPLRIYASPLDRPDHAWASFEDLTAIAGMDEVDRPRWLAKMQQELPDMVHRLPDGTVIVAEPMVGGMFYDLDELDHDGMQDIMDAWTAAWQQLFALQLAELPGDTWRQVVHEAELRNVPHVRGETMLQ